VLPAGAEAEAAVLAAAFEARAARMTTEEINALAEELTLDDALWAESKAETAAKCAAPRRDRPTELAPMTNEEINALAEELVDDAHWAADMRATAAIV